MYCASELNAQRLTQGFEQPAAAQLDDDDGNEDHENSAEIQSMRAELERMRNELEVLHTVSFVC